MDFVCLISCVNKFIICILYIFFCHLHQDELCKFYHALLYQHPTNFFDTHVCNMHYALHHTQKYLEIHYIIHHFEFLFI
jgi:hypothetical protein